jgi:hypothetical protein
MCIHARLLKNRRTDGRTGIDSMAMILQDRAQAANAILNDLTCGGCRVSADLALAAGERITIDLPAIGPRPAQVIILAEGSTGLIFDSLLTLDQVDMLSAAHRPAGPQEQDDQTLSPRRRLGIIIAAAIFAWCLAIILGWTVMRLI